MYVGLDVLILSVSSFFCDTMVSYLVISLIYLIVSSIDSTCFFISFIFFLLIGIGLADKLRGGAGGGGGGGGTCVINCCFFAIGLILYTKRLSSSSSASRILLGSGIYPRYSRRGYSFDFGCDSCCCCCCCCCCDCRGCRGCLSVAEFIISLTLNSSVLDVSTYFSKSNINLRNVFTYHFLSGTYLYVSRSINLS